MMSIEDIRKQEMLRVQAIISNFKTIEKSEDSDIEKAVAVSGEIHTWNGKKFKKQPNGKWVEVSEKGMSKKEHIKESDQDKKLSVKHFKGGSTRTGEIYEESSKRNLEHSSKLSDKEHTDEEVGLGKGKKEDIKKSVSDNDIQKAFDVLSSHYTDQGITKGEQTPAQKAKIEKVMKEFKEGTLKSSTGEKITDHKQALAIAMNEAGVSNKE